MANPVSRSPLLPLQIALYRGLSDELSVPVCDYVKETQEPPYVVLGECTERPDNAHGSYGSDMTHTFHAVVKKEGFVSALVIIDELSQALDHRLESLIPEGHRLVSVRREMTQTLRDPDPSVRHAVVRYRIVTEQLMDGG